MAKQNETKNETTVAVSNSFQSIYKFSYTYIAKDSTIRTGAIAIEGNNEDEARKEAETRLAATSLRHPRITKVSVY